MVCKMGYTGNGTFCENIDECLADNGGCNTNANCTDTMGSRTCQCKSGYTGINIILNSLFSFIFCLPKRNAYEAVSDLLVAKISSLMTRKNAKELRIL